MNGLVQISLFCGLLLCLSEAQRVCPNGWTQDRNSCYFTGERFNGQTYYSAAGFCQSFGPGAHLVEINDSQELNFVTALAGRTSWVDGPWIGLLRPFGDRRYVLPTTRTQAANGDIDRLFSSFAATATYDCGGYDKYTNLGLWRCRNGGSPFCEIELA